MRYNARNVTRDVNLLRHHNDMKLNTAGIFKSFFKPQKEIHTEKKDGALIERGENKMDDFHGDKTATTKEKNRFWPNQERPVTFYLVMVPPTDGGVKPF
jgi:hypothetical protein